MSEKMMTKNEVCEVLNISQTTLDRIVLDGMLPVYRIRGQCRFKLSDIDFYIEACKEQRNPVEKITPLKRKESRSKYAPELPSRYIPGMKVV